MSNPRPECELPDLPLGQPLRHHIGNYLAMLAATIDKCRELGAVGGAEILGRVYEQVWEIFEFHMRETDLMTGADRIGVQRNVDGDTAYLSVMRDNEIAYEVQFTKAELAAFIADSQEVHEGMVDPS